MSRLKGAAGRFAALTAMLFVVSLCASGPAFAHHGFKPYESVVKGVQPAELGAGIEVTMLDHDSQLELVNRSGRQVVVFGYKGEPYARVASEGPVYLNARSPSFYLDNDRYARTPIASPVNAKAAPDWVRTGDNGRLTWFDHRSHYMRIDTPGRVQDTTKRTLMWNYRIPITVGGQSARIAGALYWTGRKPFPTTIFIGMLVATFGCAMFGVWALRRQ